MKKVFLAIGCAALLGIGAVSCSKDDKFRDGKKAAEAYCNCLKSDQVDCSHLFTLQLSADWMRGWNEGMEACDYAY